MACNYDPSATIDNGICWYAEASYDCDYNCLIDTDGDGVCDDLRCWGARMRGRNFEAGATELDESCQYLDECGECGGTGTLGCTDPGRATTMPMQRATTGRVLIWVLPIALILRRATSIRCDLFGWVVCVSGVQQPAGVQLRCDSWL